MTIWGPMGTKSMRMIELADWCRKELPPSFDDIRSPAERVSEKYRYFYIAPAKHDSGEVHNFVKTSLRGSAVHAYRLTIITEQTVDVFDSMNGHGQMYRTNIDYQIVESPDDWRLQLHDNQHIAATEHAYFLPKKGDVAILTLAFGRSAQ